jgi:hypothetical protein
MLAAPPARLHRCSITDTSWLLSHCCHIAVADSHCGLSASLAAGRLHWNHFTQPEQWALGGATTTTLVEGAVAKLWLDELAKPTWCAPSDEEYWVEALNHPIHTKTSRNQTWCTQYCLHLNNISKNQYIGVRRTHTRSCQNYSRC